MVDETRLVVQVAIGLVFLFSVTGKLLNPSEFAKGVMEYRILPKSLALGVGLLLIPLEFFLAVSHLSGWLLSIAVPLGLATLTCFAIAVAVNLQRGSVLPCYCLGGQSGETISKRTLARLLLLFAGDLFVLSSLVQSAGSNLTYPGRVVNLPQLGLLLFWATLLLVVGFWVLSVTDLIALLRRCSTCSSRRTQLSQLGDQ